MGYRVKKLTIGKGRTVSHEQNGEWIRQYFELEMDIPDEHELVTAKENAEGLFYVFIFAIFYIIGSMLGIIPEPLKKIVEWIGSNFMLITFLLVSFMVFLVVMRLTGSKRRQPQP